MARRSATDPEQRMDREAPAQALGGMFRKIDVTSEEQVDAGFAKARAAATACATLSAPRRLGLSRT